MAQPVRQCSVAAHKVKRFSRLFAALVALAAGPVLAAGDPCEAHQARYGAHPLSVGGAITLLARDGSPNDMDMQCLEKVWNPRDGAVAATATRALLMVASRHPGVAMRAATLRPGIYKDWMADLARYGLHDVNGEAKLLRRSIARLLAARPAADQAAGRQLLLEGLGAVQPFRLE